MGLLLRENNSKHLRKSYQWTLYYKILTTIMAQNPEFLNKNLEKFFNIYTKLKLFNLMCG